MDLRLPVDLVQPSPTVPPLSPTTMTSVKKPKDTIRVNALRIYAPIGKDHQHATLQPILATISILHDIARAARKDDLALTVDYGLLSSALVVAVSSTPQLFECLDALLAFTVNVASQWIGEQLRQPCPQLRVLVAQNAQPSKCDGLSIEFSRVEIDHDVQNRTTHFIKDLQCQVLVGVNDIERKYKQLVRFNLSIERATTPFDTSHWLDIQSIINALIEVLEESAFLTLEALADFAASELLRLIFPLTSADIACTPNVTVIASKPGALPSAFSADVEICRSFADYPTTYSINSSGSAWTLLGSGHSALFEDQPSIHTVAIALGSNLGDSCHFIELALRLLETPMQVLNYDTLQTDDARVEVIDTSFMYRTKPMYVEDQPPFFNCACIVETNLQPVLLLKLLKAIENLVGRVPSIRNGPRAIDLDLLLYDDLIIDTRPQDQRVDLNNLEGQLIVPHPRLQEREFALRPLFDMIPDYVHPIYKRTIRSLLDSLPDLDPQMESVIPFPVFPQIPDNQGKLGSFVPATGEQWSHFQNASPASKQPRAFCKTYIMATLNVTPDSFSDGSRHNQLDAALDYVQHAAASGASIIDIGGYSTRPGAAFVPIEDEIDRVVPVIQTIRQQENPVIRDMLISVDTFRPEVARAAILAGANCINDVYAFTGPNAYLSPDGTEAHRYMAEMKRIARESAVPVILMHSRGDAGQHKDYSDYSYAESSAGGVGVEGVRIELGRKVDQIVKGPGGVRRWLVVVDPGIGFSKTLEVNLDVLRNARLVNADDRIGKDRAQRNPLRGYPILIGASKKTFLGTILGQGEASRETAACERGWATAATVACAVQQGAFVIRVHDTREMHDVVKVSRTIWG